MTTPARLIRTIVDDIPGPHRELSRRDQDRRDLILSVGRTAMARYGRDQIALSEFALALRLEPRQVRIHFPDLDHLLGTILRSHVAAAYHAIALASRDSPDPHRDARRAYYDATRAGFGSFNEAHLLFVRDRDTLPADERDTIDESHAGLAHMLDAKRGLQALALLDTPGLTLPEIEAYLAELDTPDPDPSPDIQAAPEPPKPEPPGPALPYKPPACLPRHIRRRIAARLRTREDAT
jgi:AcrR family transcriptional regulator